MDFKRGFCDLATQYYVAARLAARAGLPTVYGNLFHRAVEMYLKAALVGTLSVEEMRRSPYSHDLTALWARFKQRAADTALDHYDETIRQLQVFESVRYPDAIVSEGMFVSIAWRPGDTAMFADVPRYEVIISNVDTLIIQILNKALINPRFYGGWINDHAKEAFRYENPQADKWRVGQ